MKVELYSSSVAPAIAGTPSPQQDDYIFKVEDQMSSSDMNVIAAFLEGLASEFDPPPQSGSNSYNNRAIMPSRFPWKIFIVDDDEKIISSIISAKPKVIAATLRGAAKNLVKPKHVTRESSQAVAF